MELLYVWIEEYKNIKNQGFNLSPNHNFKLENKSEGNFYFKDIFKGEKQPNNFLGDNISNVTTIIGKNGSGKSSLLDSIQNLIRQNKLPSNKFIEIEYLKIIMISKEKENFYVISKNNESESLDIYLDDNKLEIRSFYDIKNIYYDNIILKKPLIREKFKKVDISSQELYIDSEENIRKFASHETKRSLIFLNNYEKLKLENLKKKIGINLPKICYLKLGNKEYIEINEFNEELIKEVALNIMKKIGEKEYVNILEDLLLDGPLNSNSLNEESFEVAINNNINVNYKRNGMTYKNQKREEEFDFIEEKIQTYIDIFEELKNQLFLYQKFEFDYDIYMEEENFDKLKRIIKRLNLNKNNDGDNMYKKFTTYTIRTLGKEIESGGPGKRYFNYVKYFNEFIENGNKKSLVEFKIETKLDGSNIDYLVEFLMKIQEDPIQEEILTYEFDINMSSGERAFLGIFSRFYSIIEKIDVLIVMDEPEMFMHPEWQRKFINIFIKFIESLLPNKKIQIITTSHSPFMASDLPRENIIMLETYTEDDKETKFKEDDSGYQKIGNCKIKKQKNLKTFGANIHELYKESFFMDSTMGEFALSKIRGVIEDLTTLECFKKDEEFLKKLENIKDSDLSDSQKAREKMLEDYKETRKSKENEIRSRQSEIKYIIDQIGERILSKKLGEKYREIFGEKETEEDKLYKQWKDLSKEKQLELLNKEFGGQ